jgi:hypothetical protein
MGYSMCIGGEALHHHPPDMTATSFQIGHTYSGRFVGDADSVFQVKILKRTAKTVTVAGPKGIAQHRVTVDHEGGEQIFPFGKYSMAPVCRAKRLVA